MLVLKLALTVVAIALPDCINPSLIGGELFVAAGPRAKWRTAAFTAAAWIVTFVFGLAIGLGLGDLILALLPKPGATVKYALITAAGAVLVAGASFIWLRREELVGSEATPARGKPHGSAALIGAGVAGLELPTAFPYFAAIALIIGSGVSRPAKLALLVLYCIVYTLPLIAIVVVCVVMGNTANRILAPTGDWLSTHWPAIAAPLTATMGIAVLVFGIVQLRST